MTDGTKIRVYYSQEDMAYKVLIYRDIGRQRFFAKLSDLTFEEEPAKGHERLKEYTIVEEIDHIEEGMHEKMYDELKSNKKEHVNNLNDIIDKFFIYNERIVKNA